MNIIEAIRHRRSVRSFDGTALRPEDAKAILDFAAGVENPYDIHIDWRLLDAKEDALSCPVVVGTDAYIAGKLRPVPHADISVSLVFVKSAALLVLLAASARTKFIVPYFA